MSRHYEKADIAVFVMHHGYHATLEDVAIRIYNLRQKISRKSPRLYLIVLSLQ